jgi:hypothetical protein
MAATYAASRTLANTATFQDQCRMAAIQVVGDNVGSTNQAIRDFNRRVLWEWGGISLVIIEAVAVTPSITTTSTDADVKARLGVLWPTLAGLVV